MSRPCFFTHYCIVTPCVNNESSLLYYLFNCCIVTPCVNNESSLLYYP
ncbi:hypothetical protein KSS87_019624 [Heliosperma pusillum]|nr:hypothetical protein KSS87_019624 [Heliosperma pusillum]